MMLTKYLQFLSVPNVLAQNAEPRISSEHDGKVLEKRMLCLNNEDANEIDNLCGIINSEDSKPMGSI